MNKSPLAFTRTAQLLTLLAAAPLALQSARSASDTWNGNATPDTDWATAGNWATNPATVPGTGDTATFSTSANTTVSAISPVTIGNVVFDAAASNYTVTAPLTLDAGGSVTVNGGNQSLSSVTVTPGASGSFSSSTGTTALVGAGPAITATGGLTISSLSATGPGVGTTTVNFSGTGVTTVSASIAGSNSSGNLTAINKSGSGVLVLGNSNTALWGGFTVTGGTVIDVNNNGLSNRGLTIGNATFQQNRGNQQSFNNAAGSVNVTGDTHFVYNNTGNWGIGQTVATGNTSEFKSTGSPVATFSVTSANQNGIRISANNSGFTGTYLLGQNGALTFNAAARGSSSSTLNMGAAGMGSHYFSTGISTHLPATQSFDPIKFGALTGADPAAVLSGRQNIGSGTTGTQFEIGALGTNTTYAGQIRDGSTAGLLLQTNGTTTGAAQTATATLAASSYNRGSAAGVQGTTELVKVGGGTLTLTGTNTHTGGTVIKSGAIAVSSDAALGATYDGSLRAFQLTLKDTDPVASGEQGSVVYQATALPSAVLTGGGTPTTAANLNIFSTLTPSWTQNNLFLSFSSQNNNSAPAVVANNLNGLGYTSVPTVSFTGGTITTPGDAPVAQVRVTGLLTLDGGALQTDAGITSNRAIVIGAGNGAIETMGFNSTFSGNINGSGNLALNGGGTVTLSAANALTGVTTVGANTTLNLSGSLAGTVTVNATGHLAGNGSAAGATINGEISPGNSIGTLTFSGSATLAGVSTIELDPGASTADLINITAGGITLGGDLNVSLLSGAAAGTYNIIDAPSFSGSFANVNLPALSVGLTWDTSLLNTQGILSIVPEPASASLAVVSLGLLGRRRRRIS